MKKLILLCMLLAVCLASWASDKKHAFGAMLGTQTGLSYRYIMDEKVFIDAGLDYRLGDKSNLYASYSMLAPKPLLIFGQVMRWYYGVGTRIRSREEDGDLETQIGLRGAAGLLYMPKTEPFELFAQAAPVFNIIPSSNLDLDVNIGIRFVF